MKIADCRRQGRVLSVRWADGRKDRFHLLWLRDNCLDPVNLDPETGERRVDFHTIPLDVDAEEITVSKDGGLTVTWSDLPLQTHYPADWLRAHAFDNSSTLAESAAIPEPEGWRFATVEEMPRFSYDAVLSEPSRELALLTAFRRYGIALIEGAPARAGIVEALTQRMGYLREVCFGRVRDLKTSLKADNVAFTSVDVKPHTDGSNYRWPYEVQFLHCMVQGARGGDSYVVDGFAVAEALRRDDPAAFELLSRIRVAYKVGSGSFDVRHSGPVFDLDRDGNLRFVRYSNQQRRVLEAALEDIEPFYAAYHKLSAMMNDPARQIAFRLRVGDVLMFDNHRVLHARTAFEAASGIRHLQLATTDRDMVDSRVRILQREQRQGT